MCVREVDYYELLGVRPGATSAEIRSAYRSLAKVMHPDAGGTAGTFRLLREAYETLSDPQSRADYDRGEETGEDQEVRVPKPPPPWREDTTPPLPVIDHRTIPWWDMVSRRVTFVPTGRPPVGLVAGVVAGWLVILFVLVTVGAPVALIAGWLVVLAVLGTVAARQLAAADRADRAFFGEFGTRRVFGSPGTEEDEAGERLTADLLSLYLARIPAVRVCHGLAGEPGSVFADVDHAVLCGRRLVLVESKVWLPGHYRMDDENVVWRNGHLFRGGTSGLASRLAAYRALLPWLDVRGVLLLHPSRPGTITVDEQDALVQPMEPEGFVRVVGAWLAGDQSTVDRTALATLVGQVRS